MTLFYLYRLKIERSDRRSMFDDQTRQPGAVILSAIEEKPSQEIRKGQTWHIGNIQKVDEVTVFFALGKVTKATHGLYDEERGDFIEAARHGPRALSPRSRAPRSATRYNFPSALGSQ